MQREQLEQKLEEFKQECLAKFDKGRSEHNDDLTSLDFDKEIKDEIKDIVVYFLMKEFITKKQQPPY